MLNNGSHSILVVRVGRMKNRTFDDLDSAARPVDHAYIPTHTYTHDLVLAARESFLFLSLDRRWGRAGRV